MPCCVEGLDDRMLRGDDVLDSGTRLKVLSIVGAGRSGTTLLASIFEEIDGFASAGEIRWLWQRGIQEAMPCGCGNPPTLCPVWSPVVSRALKQLGEGSPPLTVPDIIDAQRELEAPRNMLRVINRAASTGENDPWTSLATVRRAVGSVCDALAQETGAKALVDTSKRAVDAAVMNGSGVDHYVLHIVRDPRGVVHSWRRAKTVTTGGRTLAMETRALPATVRRWTRNAMLAELLRRRLPSSRWYHVRYEDFVANPRSSVESILTFMGENAEAPFVDDHTVLLRPNHIVVGNPSRFTTGEVTIRVDDNWRREMPRRDRALVTLSTLPLMARYGYLGPAGSSTRKRRGVDTGH